MSDDFQIAYARARARLGEALWNKAIPRERTNAIYEELAKLDAERVANGAGKRPES